MLRGLRIGVLQATEARSALADPPVPQQGPVILRVARGAQVGVGDAGRIDGACEVGLGKPGLRLMGVRRTSATMLIWAESRAATNDAISRPSYPADHSPRPAASVWRNRSSSET